MADYGKKFFVCDNGGEIEVVAAPFLQSDDKIIVVVESEIWKYFSFYRKGGLDVKSVKEEYEKYAAEFKADPDAKLVEFARLDTK